MQNVGIYHVRPQVQHSHCFRCDVNFVSSVCAAGLETLVVSSLYGGKICLSVIEGDS